MIKDRYLSRFTPSLLAPETLEAILVQREKLAARLVELIRESVLTRNKHYALLVGPRGIGKTHMVSVVYHRVLAEADLRDRLRIAWLREEECVFSFLDFLQAILGVLQEEYDDEQLKQDCEELRNLSIEEAEVSAEQLLLGAVDKKTLLLIAENLDGIFGGLGREGQEKLRALIQNHPVFTILATSQSLFGGVSMRTSPFYGFFETHHLQALSLEDAVTMMAKIARHQGNEELASLIQKPQGRFRVRALHHLAGGNPRVYVIFSQLVTCKSLDELVEPVLQTLDDLTPYYQERMRHLSPQQRKIVDHLCQRRHAVSVGEIAEHNRVTHQTASSQLKKLRDMGYVRADQTGRESYYELREPLMRISLEVKKIRGEPIRLLVAFLRVWYSQSELAERLKDLRSGSPLDCQSLEPDDARVTACLRDFSEALDRCDFKSALTVTEELVATRGFTSDGIAHARCLIELGRQDEAEDSARKALESHPDSAEGWRDRGAVLVKLERHDEALECFEKSLELRPGDAETWNCKGVALDRMGRYEEMLPSAQKAVQLDPADPLTWRNQAVAFEKLNRFEEALASYRRVIELEPNEALNWRFRALPLGQLKRYEEALASCDKAIELNPNDPVAWRCRAYPLCQLKSYKEAVKSYDKAIELDPNDAIAWRDRAYPLRQLERYEEAVKSYDKAIELDPNDAVAWQIRADLLCQLKRHREALDCYDRVIEFRKDDAVVWRARAMCLDAIGRYAEALVSADESLELEPDSQSGLGLRAIILYRLGRREQSLATLERLLESDPDNYNAWGNRAVALSSLGRHEEALASFDRSLELASAKFDFHLSSNCAVVLATLGRWDEGISALDDALRRFAEEGGIDARGEVAIVRNMLIRTQEVATWRRHIEAWIDLFDKHDVLPALGQGLVRSIPTLGISWIDDDVARTWRDVWQELGRACPELEIPLRLLDAAVRYREKPDVRVLLGLPIEERELLKPLLGLGEMFDEKTITDRSV